MGLATIFGCAESAPPPVSFASPPAPAKASAPAATSTSTRAAPPGEDGGVETAYTLDVEIVPAPLSATSLLARIEESGTGVDPAASCRARLIARASRLGANALYIEPVATDSATCAAKAYQVRRLTTAQRSALQAWSNELSVWLVMRWDIPAAIPDRDRMKLCVVYQFDVNRRMEIIFVRQEPIRPSGNARFDESARMLLEKTMAERVTLPSPPNVLAPGGGFLTVRVPLVGGREAHCG